MGTEKTFRNLYTGEVQTWPMNHFYSVAVEKGARLTYNRDGKPFELSLAFGAVDTPQRTPGLAVAAMRAIQAAFPEIADRLRLVALPCAFCHRDDMVELDDRDYQPASAAEFDRNRSRLYM